MAEMNNHLENNIIKFLAIIIMLVSIKFLVSSFAPEVVIALKSLHGNNKMLANVSSALPTSLKIKVSDPLSVTASLPSLHAQQNAPFVAPSIDTSYDHLVIPKINIDDSIVYVKSVKKMGLSVWDRTSNLKNKNNRVIVGHSIIQVLGKIHLPIPRHGVFFDLENLTEGDVIYVIEGGDVETYQVSKTMLVDDSEIWVEKDTKEKQLTLYSCRGADGNKYGSESRIVVFADKIQ